MSRYRKLPWWRQKTARAALNAHKCPSCGVEFDCYSGIPDMDGIGGNVCGACGLAWTDHKDWVRNVYRIIRS